MLINAIQYYDNEHLMYNITDLQKFIWILKIVNYKGYINSISFNNKTIILNKLTFFLHIK